MSMPEEGGSDVDKSRKHHKRHKSSDRYRPHKHDRNERPRSHEHRKKKRMDGGEGKRGGRDGEGIELKKVTLPPYDSDEDRKPSHHRIEQGQVVTTERIKQPFKTFEEALERVGMFGRYQIFTCVVIQYASILWAGNYSFMSLARLEPDWRCDDPGWNHTIHPAPTRQSVEACKMIHNCTKQNLTTINNEFFSLVEDWKLVCENENIPDLLFVIYIVGQMAGSFFGGHLGDFFGRKKGFFSAQFLIIVTGVLNIASTSWQAFAATQILNGFFFGVIEVTALCLMMEYTDSKYRLIPNAMFQWCLGYMVLALIAVLTRNWRMYIVFVNLVSAPLLVGYLLFLESPRWQIMRGKYYEASKVLNDIASERWNKKNVEIMPADLVEINKIPHTKFYFFIHLFKTKKLAVQTILQILSIFTYSLVDSTYVFNVNAVPGGIFMHFFYYGLLRVWVAPVVIVLDWKFEKFGRKLLLLASLGITGVCFLINIILLAAGVTATHPSVVVFTIIGTTINSSAFYMAIIQITTATYPTVVRNTAFGVTHMFIYIGALISTLVFEPLASKWAPFPYLIPEIFVVFNFILAFFLQPETKGKKLPDSFEDLKRE